MLNYIALYIVLHSTCSQHTDVMVDGHSIKGELYLDKKWQSDDLFYIVMNEIHPRFNQFCVILKLS